MAGTHGYLKRPLMTVLGYSAAAVTAGQHLTEGIVPFSFRIGAIKADAGGAGSGAGSTVLDVLVNGTSVFDTSGNKPTLATGSTGEFANIAPDHRSFPLRAGSAGNVVAIDVSSIPASSGHTRVKATVVIEEP